MSKVRERERNRLKSRLWRLRNPERSKAYTKAYRQGLKAEILQAYGGKCQCCGEAHAEFLSIDHVNNDGASHRRQVGVGVSFWVWLKRNGYPRSCQILCFNCNMSKGFFGYCPHG